MDERRKVSSEVSAFLLDYVLQKAAITQDALADALEVSPAFISRVRTRERSFTIDHLAAIEKLMKVPLGAILLAAIPLPAPQPQTARLQELARKAIAQADAAARIIAERRRAASR